MLWSYIESSAASTTELDPLFLRIHWACCSGRALRKNSSLKHSNGSRFSQNLVRYKSTFPISPRYVSLFFCSLDRILKYSYVFLPNRSTSAFRRSSYVLHVCCDTSLASPTNSDLSCNIFISSVHFICFDRFSNSDR